MASSPSSDEKIDLYLFSIYIVNYKITIVTLSDLYIN